MKRKFPTTFVSTKTATAVLLALSLSHAGAVLAESDSAAAEKRRASMEPLDLTGFLKSENDARSRDFLYGRWNRHDFQVKTPGVYTFESHVPAGENPDNRIEARLLDSQGQVIAEGQGLGRQGGLEMSQRLEPGDYVLEVQGYKFGAKSNRGDGFFVTVSGQDAQGRQLAEGIDDGGGIVFGGPGKDGRSTAFVRSSESVVPLAAGGAVAASAKASSDNAPVEREPIEQASTDPRPGDVAISEQASSSAESPAEPSGLSQGMPAAASSQASETGEAATPERGFDEIVTDVKIRAKGEVLTFEVAQAGTVAITTSTFADDESNYRIEARVLNEQDEVVAKDKGEGFNGDVDIKTVLEPGRYRVWVQGQKFGSAMSGVNNYELRVKQLDIQ
ncbi:hypothetical protein [Pistricoccus aurantiacus]|uniref:hypothetical protein n=1 Tax=Pistricoccus aurantiacus TaxID=1883414 RepID=UPI0016441FED|nr:hypothetical protein [Pistricoccus aurantiacus]